ncbi:NAD(P)H-quinone oxidoreductase subunit H, chloroplastic-like [Vicia villosa]|uniref:NAD(P)H-quinone oxidoreductase subunit H, chloroplastic-like n=1 Tax=Vicia villosa TaxID=3911 RepID=UPI00273BF837|nr:NAD(P)H-quinone oxidoreductase subunit H, chloroplastic-like [Vicia villosa]
MQGNLSAWLVKNGIVHRSLGFDYQGIETLQIKPEDWHSMAVILYVANYECYKEFDWEVQWQKEGDSLARYLVRIGEMVESIKIIQQALEGIPGGLMKILKFAALIEKRSQNGMILNIDSLIKKSSPTFELPKQELYVRVEAPKGELGIFLIGDQNGFPSRWKIRPPGFINLQILPQLVKRMKPDAFSGLGLKK